MMEFKRKAQVSTQFNWIFILIVGGLILSMFVAFSSKQKSIAEVQIDARSLEGINTIFEL